jgi:hypothetical protein
MSKSSVAYIPIFDPKLSPVTLSKSINFLNLFFLVSHVENIKEIWLCPCKIKWSNVRVMEDFEMSMHKALTNINCEWFQWIYIEFCPVSGVPVFIIFHDLNKIRVDLF